MLVNEVGIMAHCHLADSHLADRHLANIHLVDGHLADSHFGDSKFDPKSSMSVVLTLWCCGALSQKSAK